jgi:hypothetical protein
MLRLVVRIIQLQFLALFVCILCDWLAGPKDAVVWFVGISLTLLAFAVYGQIIRHRQR